VAERERPELSAKRGKPARSAGLAKSSKRVLPLARGKGGSASGAEHSGGIGPAMAVAGGGQVSSMLFLSAELARRMVLRMADTARRAPRRITVVQLTFVQGAKVRMSLRVVQVSWIGVKVSLSPLSVKL
jgi:hypothetical protein